MLTAITDRLLAIVTPTVEAQAYKYCTYLNREYCRNHMRYIWQVCYDCGSNNPLSCRITGQGYIDYGPC